MRGIARLARGAVGFVVGLFLGSLVNLIWTYAVGWFVPNAEVIGDIPGVLRVPGQLAVPGLAIFGAVRGWRGLRKANDGPEDIP